MNSISKYLFLLLLFSKSFSQGNVKSIIRERFSDFENSIKDARSISRDDCIAFINKRLENNDEKFIYTICDFIKQDSLIECIPNLERYITNCNRENYASEYSLYRLAQIGSGAEKEFVLNDFKRHLNDKYNTIGWLKTYIVALEKLNISNAHSLLDGAFFDWYGIDRNFIKFPVLFDIKKTLEEQYFLNFPKELINEGYRLNNVIVFIDNTAEAAKGKIPQTRFIVEIKLPYDSGYPDRGCCEIEEASLKRVQEIIGLPKENIYLAYKYGGNYLKQEERFGNSGLTVQYIDYLSKFPNSEYLTFIRELYKHNYFSDYDKYYVEKFLVDKK